MYAFCTTNFFVTPVYIKFLHGLINKTENINQQVFLLRISHWWLHTSILGLTNNWLSVVFLFIQIANTFLHLDRHLSLYEYINIVHYLKGIYTRSRQLLLHNSGSIYLQTWLLEMVSFRNKALFANVIPPMVTGRTNIAQSRTSFISYEGLAWSDIWLLAFIGK